MSLHLKASLVSISALLTWPGFFVSAEIIDKTRRPVLPGVSQQSSSLAWPGLALLVHVFPLSCRLTARLCLGLIPVNAVSSLSPHFISAFSGRVVCEAQRQNILVSETFVFQDGKSAFMFYISPIIRGNSWRQLFSWKISHAM